MRILLGLTKSTEHASTPSAVLNVIMYCILYAKYCIRDILYVIYSARLEPQSRNVSQGRASDASQLHNSGVKLLQVSIEVERGPLEDYYPPKGWLTKLWSPFWILGNIRSYRCGSPRWLFQDSLSYQLRWSIRAPQKSIGPKPSAKPEGPRYYRP